MESSIIHLQFSDVTICYVTIDTCDIGMLTRHNIYDINLAYSIKLDEPTIDEHNLTVRAQLFKTNNVIS